LVDLFASNAPGVFVPNIAPIPPAQTKKRRPCCPWRGASLGNTLKLFIIAWSLFKYFLSRPFLAIPCFKLSGRLSGLEAL
jgi:hypothetical protein